MLVVAGVGGGLMDVGVVVAGLGGVSWGGVLAGATGHGGGAVRGGVDVVELVGPVDPQMVLARVRLVAGVSGRLLVLIVGELRKDPRKGGLHIGLGAPGQGSAAVRYSGLPWEWLVGELAIRPTGSTTVLLDVAAEADVWETVRAGGLPDAYGVGVFGRVVRQGRESKWRRLRGGTVPTEPTYLQECVRMWRAGGRMPFAELHERAASASHATEGHQAVFVAPTTAEPAAPVGSQGAPAGSAENGHQPWQSPSAQNGWAPQTHEGLPPWTPSAAPLPSGTGASQPVNGAEPPPRSVQDTRPVQDARRPTDVPWSTEAQQPSDVPRHTDVQRPADTQSFAPPEGAPPSTVPDAETRSVAPPEVVRPHAPASIPPPVEEAAVLPAQDREDPHAAIMTAARAGRHEEAEGIAVAWQRTAEQTEGPGSEGVLHWVEVRADLARLAGAPARSCELWMWVARGRLELGEADDSSDVEGAVDRAHHQWERLRVENVEAARELVPELVVLRRRVPGRQPGAVRLLEERMDHLLGGVDH
ncbi:hypothetical protein DQ392_08045 [Streptomyces reniochalinae]|uniref:Uncharacterized protein n=1 Tax=Streptomyces reniochalinae TaxID=2250578 RepID=A0A367EVX0_9ACTN|nr:hypothetical protein DQ392_08045 [Streptomyces reniochalinae]